MAEAPEREMGLTDTEWQQKAACLNTSPELFFPVGVSGPALEQIERAKDVCRTCMVQTVCLEYALSTNQDHGVWGGTSEEERRKLRRVWIAQRRQAM